MSRTYPIKTITTLYATAVIMLASHGAAHSSLSIDIVKSPRKLPIAVMELTGPYGSQISQTVRDDLALSGLFEPMDEASFIERPAQRFSKARWAGTGAEAVVKGEVLVGKDLTVTVTLYDVVEGTAVMAKQYRTTRKLVKPLAHSISNDIYKQITGREGVFRSRIAYVVNDDDGAALYMADWDGKRSRKLGVRASIILAPRWHWSSKNIIYSAQRGKRWGIFRLDLSTMKEEPLIQEKGTNIAGGFFPDGDRFTFSSSREGTPDIYTYYIRRRKFSRLTRDYGIEVSPSISPNGEEIVYVSDRTGSPHIYTMDKFGYNKSRLTYEGSYNTSPSWSPDGKLVVYSGWQDGKNQVFTIRADGRGIRQLTVEGNNEEPSFSPDGRFIVFTSDRGGSKAVFVMRSGGEDQRMITTHGMKTFSPRWSPK